MSLSMDQGADALLQAALAGASPDELSDVEVDGDGDGSSSLSDIEEKDGDQDEDAEVSDELSNISDDENDSEAETERLEESPNKFRTQKDVVLSSHHENQSYEHNPSKLHSQVAVDDQDDDNDDDPLSDADVSMDEESPESPKSSTHEDEDAEVEHPTAPTSLDEAPAENKNLLSIESDTRKRKRSIMAGSGLEEEIGEPVRKRTGSVINNEDGYAIEEDPQQEEDADMDESNPISGNISDEGRVAQEDELPEALEEPEIIVDEVAEVEDTPASPRKRGRRGRRKSLENGLGNHAGNSELLPGADTTLNGGDEARHAEEDNADNEGDDDAEAAQRNEEELEKKRIALDQLGAIERQFTQFRERLYTERLEQLNREEAMLKSANATHPEYLAMMQCLDARRDEKIRIANTLREYQLESLKRSAVAKRSQILSQYQQEVRDTRERKLEQLGKQWYEIQHDRRSYAGSVPDYTLRFPTRRSQQVQNQIAYSNEISILAGVAKYVGFPAAPAMASATQAELDDDLEKMSRTRQTQHVQHAHLPLQELAAIRTAAATSRFKPAEEQYIKETPWANPHHPSHAHLLQRQASAQQTSRPKSPFSSSQAQRRHSHHHGTGVPISGTFSNSPSLLGHSKGLAMSGGRISPHHPFGNANHTIAPSPLGSRQPSLSPQQTHTAPVGLSDQHIAVTKANGLQHSPANKVPEITRNFPQEVRQEQIRTTMGRAS